MKFTWVKNIIALFSTKDANAEADNIIEVSEEKETITLNKIQATKINERLGSVNDLEAQITALKEGKEAAETALKTAMKSINTACGLDENTAADKTVEKIAEFKKFPGATGANTATEKEKVNNEQKDANKVLVDELTHNKKADQFTFF